MDKLPEGVFFLIVRVEAGDRVFAQEPGEERGASPFLEVVTGERGQTRGFTIRERLIAAGTIIGDEGASEIRVGGSVEQGFEHVDINLRATSSHQGHRAVVVVLLVVGCFKANGAIEEGLREIDVETMEILPLVFVRTIEQLVVKVENRWIGQRKSPRQADGTAGQFHFVREVAVESNGRRLTAEHAIDAPIDGAARSDTADRGRPVKLHQIIESRTISGIKDRQRINPGR